VEVKVIIVVGEEIFGGVGRIIKFSVQCTVTLMSMTGNLSPLTTQSEIVLVNRTRIQSELGQLADLVQEREPIQLLENKVQQE